VLGPRERDGQLVSGGKEISLILTLRRIGRIFFSSKLLNVIVILGLGHPTLKLVNKYFLIKNKKNTQVDIEDYIRSVN